MHSQSSCMAVCINLEGGCFEAMGNCLLCEGLNPIFGSEKIRALCWCNRLFGGTRRRVAELLASSARLSRRSKRCQQAASSSLCLPITKAEPLFPVNPRPSHPILFQALHRLPPQCSLSFSGFVRSNRHV